MNMLSFAAVPCGLSLALAQGPAEPVFTSGDLAALECKVLALKSVDDYTQLLTIEVQNQGAVGAEPLEFRIELAAKKPDPPKVETFARAQLPHVARYGRPAPAGGKQTYVLPTRLPGKKAQFAVRVTSASFVEGGAVPKFELEFGKPRQVQRESLAGKFPVTQVGIKNPLDHDVDVLMLVKFEQPKDLVDLVGVRLAARASRELLIATRPPAEAYLDALSELPGCAIKATGFQVVDWCLCGAMSPDAALAALREAYVAWYRWPEADLALAGDFTYGERSVRVDAPNQYGDVRVKGRFRIAASGDVQVEITEGKGANASFLLRDTISNLRRPDFDAFAKANRLVPVTADRIAVIGPGWGLIEDESGRHRIDGDAKAEESPDLEVRNGRLESDGMGNHDRSQWEMQDCNGATVVTRRHSASTDTRFAYGLVDGRLLPTGASRVVTNQGQLFSAAELTLANLEFDGVVMAAPRQPTGAGASALRALWDAAYHIPTDALEVEARFEVTTGNDGVWGSHKKITGGLVMQGIGRHLRGSDCRFDGGLAREDEVQLAALLRDRLLLWYGADFNDRPTFDEFFGEAVIGAPDGGGGFPVENSQIERVWTSEGLVRGWRWRGGCTTRFTYGKVGDRQVVTRIDQQMGGAKTPAARRWEATTHVTLAPVGEHLLPTKLVFEHIFGREWTPETIVFRDVRLRRR